MNLGGKCVDLDIRQYRDNAVCFCGRLPTPDLALSHQYNQRGKGRIENRGLYFRSWNSQSKVLPNRTEKQNCQLGDGFNGDFFYLVDFSAIATVSGESWWTTYALVKWWGICWNALYTYKSIAGSTYACWL